MTKHYEWQLQITDGSDDVVDTDFFPPTEAGLRDAVAFAQKHDHAQIVLRVQHYAGFDCMGQAEAQLDDDAFDDGTPIPARFVKQIAQVIG